MLNKIKKLSTAPYRGVRDFYPEEQFIHNHIFDTCRLVVEKFGYLEYSASVLEPEELYTSKSSEEIVKEQAYTFEDRGGRKVTLRPEMTPTIARMISAKKRELSFPLRWYSIPNLFRYERPQRGRLREHFQLNLDLFGLTGPEAEIEVITIAHSILRSLGLQEKDFSIRINNRKALWNFYIDFMGLDKKKYPALLHLLDKKDRISNEDFSSQIWELTGETFEKIEVAKRSKVGLALASETEDLLKALRERDVNNAVYDDGLVRGFDYYTGTIFEIFDTHPENKRSLFGGGRYDNLLDIFQEGRIPAVGFGMGDVTIRDSLKTHGLLPSYVSKTDLYICLLEKELAREANRLANFLRRQGLNVAVDYSGKKIGEQIKKADKDSVPFVLVLGDKETRSKIYSIKHLKTGKETLLGESEIPKFLKQA